MVTKLIGSAIVVLATTKIGYDAGSAYTRRVQELRAFQSGLWALKSEITFCQTMLAEALLKVSTLISTNVKAVFCTASENLTKQNGITAKEAWDSALTSCNKELSLKAEELAILHSFGGMLGNSDISGQITNIELTIENLKSCESEAVSAEKKSKKLCRSLGVIAGIFLAILFI